jgi:hypothetical protein
MSRNPLLPVFLITDFRETDTYVGQMRAAMMRVAGPHLPMADLTHSVPRGDVARGLFHIGRALPWLPRPSVVLAVVDPGVGSSRRAVAVRAGEVWLVGPDNGLLVPERAGEARLLPVPGDSSSTFHGRDVFAPAAASIAADPDWPRGLPAVQTSDLVRLPAAGSLRTSGGVSTVVAHVDRFGNVVLWLRRPDMPPGRRLLLDLPDGETVGAALVDHYSGGSGLLILEGSQGLMELAVNGGSAARETGLRPGDRVELRGDGR